MSAAPSPASLSDAAVEQVWDAVQRGEKSIVVNSPPGAGKSTLVRRIALRYAATGKRVPVIAQTNAQADDLTLGLARAAAARPGKALQIGRLLSRSHTPPADFAQLSNIVADTNLDNLKACRIIVTTAKKIAWMRKPVQWGLGIIDEAYQMRSDDLLSVGYRVERLLMVGDPGQLAPFTRAEEALFRKGKLPLVTDAATTILTSRPDTPVIQLPVSWRLDARSADVVSDAFYAEPFEGARGPDERRLYAQELHRAPERKAVHTAGLHGWASIELPAAFMPVVDDDIVTTIAKVIRSLLTDTSVLVDESGERSMVREGSIAVGVVQTAQRVAVQEAVSEVCVELGHAPDRVTVDTANRLQGREFDVMVVWHPLSGRRDTSEFHLDAGRLCVLLSRHKHCCIVVSRAGIREQLEGSPRAADRWVNEHAARMDGTRAHLRILENLEGHRV